MSRAPLRLGLNLALAARVLAEFIRDETRNAGFERVLLGVSGGVDSALSAALAVRALGPGNVIGVLMPYRESSPDSLAHGRLLCGSLGMRGVEVDVSPMVDAYFADKPDANRLRRGNYMARTRMAVLFDLSSAERALVIGTSNKTELLLGYGTLFGDTASVLNPLGDLYKTQVWDLSRFLGLPEEITRKAPSADLWPGQTDEAELGFSYAKADELLHLHYEGGFTEAELAAMGHQPEVVERIVSTVRRNLFKRRPTLIARVSGSAINIDKKVPRYH